MAVRARDYLAKNMAPQMGMTHHNSRRYLDLFLEEIAEALKQGNEVVFRGFGRFIEEAYPISCFYSLEVEARNRVDFRK